LVTHDLGDDRESGRGREPVERLADRCADEIVSGRKPPPGNRELSSGYSCLVLFATSAVVPSGFWLGAAVAAAAGILVFLDARKRGSSRAAAWGVGVFLMLAVVLPLYIFRVRRNKLAAEQQTSAGDRPAQTPPVSRGALARMPPLQARALRLAAFFVLLVLMEYWKTPIWLEIAAIALLAIWFTSNDLHSRQQKR
jgi:hypothetical protein